MVSVGYGLTGIFSDFVKLGLLCGDRVILWDILASKTLNAQNMGSRTPAAIAEIASNILLRTPLIKVGDVVVLPHPMMWHESAKSLQKELGQKSMSTSDIGVLTALTAILEDMQLHPYSLTSAPALSPDLIETNSAKEFFLAQTKTFIGLCRRHSHSRV